MITAGIPAISRSIPSGIGSCVFAQNTITIVISISNIITAAPMIAPFLFFLWTSILFISINFAPSFSICSISSRQSSALRESSDRCSRIRRSQISCIFERPSLRCSSSFRCCSRQICRLFFFSKRAFISSMEISILRNSLISISRSTSA